MGKTALERVLYIDKLLRDAVYPSKKRLQEHFEVSPKTIERDIDFLRDRANAPIEYCRKRSGYYYTDQNFQLPTLSIRKGDALALFVSHYFGSSWRVTPLASLADEAWSRLSMYFPEQITINPGIFSEYVAVIDQSVDIESQHWMCLFEAARERCKVHVDYCAPGYTSPVERVLHPYRIIHHKNAWYALCYDEYHQKVRVYAMGRFQRVEKLAEAFDFPEDFCLETYIDPNFGIFCSDEWFGVKLHTSKKIADIMQEHLTCKDLQIHSVDAERTVIEFQTNQKQELKFWLMQWGEHIEVKEPQWMGEELLAVAKAYMEMYGRNN